MIYGELTSPDFKRIAKNTVALLPLAAVEQHGQHLPVITDTALVTEIAQRTEAALPKKVALLPTFWAGSSHHHLDFPGTVSIQSETYIRVLKDMVDCLLGTGFQKIVLLNGHGGNVGPAAEALYRVALERKGLKAPWVTTATYWHLASEELARQQFMETPNLTHACEYETSMMLGLRVDWVKMERAKGRTCKRHSKFYDPMGYTKSRISTPETFAQITDTGAMGNPEKATPNKGKQLFDLISKVTIEFLKEFSSWKATRSNT